MADQIAITIINNAISRFPKPSDDQIKTRVEYLGLVYVAQIIQDNSLSLTHSPLSSPPSPSPPLSPLLPLSSQSQLQSQFQSKPKSFVSAYEAFEIRKLYASSNNTVSTVGSGGSSHYTDPPVLEFLGIQASVVARDTGLKDKVKRRIQSDLDAVLDFEAGSDENGESDSTSSNSRISSNGVRVLVEKQVEYFRQLVTELQAILGLLLRVDPGSSSSCSGVDEELCTSLVDFYANLVGSMDLKLKLHRAHYLRTRFDQSTTQALENANRSLQRELACLALKQHEIDAKLQVYSLGGSEFLSLANEYLRVVNLISELKTDIDTFENHL